MSGPGRVWVTRAQPGADRTADRLRALGLDPVVLPLLALRPIAQPAPDLSHVSALAFTSRNAVAVFAALTPERNRPVFAVGDATAQAARTAGFADVRSAGGDVEALARLIASERDRAGGLILHPGAREPAGDLAGTLAEIVAVRTLAIYEAVETGVAEAPYCDAVLIHSPRAARALAALAESPLLVLTISRAAAAPLKPAPGRRIIVAETPDEDALFDALRKGVSAALGKPRRDV